jgi:hypothetical protein
LVPAQIFVSKAITEMILIKNVIHVIILAQYVAIIIIVMNVTQTLIDYYKAISVNVLMVILIAVYNYVKNAVIFVLIAMDLIQTNVYHVISQIFE